MTDKSRYGECYWMVKTDLSPDGEIYLFADYFLVELGSLNFYRRMPRDAPTRSELFNAFAPGFWKSVHAASCMDGAPVAVKHWKNEVVED